MTSKTKQENSAPIFTAEQMLTEWSALKGADKATFVRGMTAHMGQALQADSFDVERAQTIAAGLALIDAAKKESNKPKVSRAQLLANRHAVLTQALGMIEGDEEYDTDLAHTMSDGDLVKQGDRLAAVRSVTRGASGDRQGWVLQACAAIGNGNHTVNDLITKSGVQYPGSNTKPNGAVGDWHVTHEGETFEISDSEGRGGTMTVGFDSGHDDSEKGHRVFIVTMD